MLNLEINCYFFSLRNLSNVCYIRKWNFKFQQTTRCILFLVSKGFFNYIKFLKNQNEYSKWSKMDANMKKEFKGTDATIGFISSWDSENKDVGKGEQEIVKITEGSRVDYEIRFKIPFESTSNAYMSTEENGPNQTKVTWEFNGKMNYPMNLMLLFMDMDKEIGSDLNIGLNNLKGIQENYN